jgi:hypothetical protein
MGNVVWLTEERCFGRLIEMGAYFSRIQYILGGVEFDVYVENDEWEFWQPLDYE